jgi:sec-independent protein translocase protein TatA
MSFPLHPLAFIEGLGGPEMVVIMLIVLVLFGGDKLPEFARGLGKSIREFKKAAAGVEEEFKRALEESDTKKAAPKILPVTTAVVVEPAALPPAPATDSTLAIADTTPISTPAASILPPSPATGHGHGRADV